MIQESKLLETLKYLYLYLSLGHWNIIQQVSNKKRKRKLKVSCVRFCLIWVIVAVCDGSHNVKNDEKVQNLDLDPNLQLKYICKVFFFNHIFFTYPAN